MPVPLADAKTEVASKIDESAPRIGRSLAKRPTKDSGRYRRSLRRLLISLTAFVAVVFALLLSARPAAAYPWMIRHEYTGCAICHGDPSGGGVLTPYGRAQGDLLLRMQYSQPKPGEETGEASPTAGFLWGLINTPDWFLP